MTALLKPEEVTRIREIFKPKKAVIRKIDNTGVFEEDDGAWLQTCSGRRVSVLNPKPEQIFIEDIAHPIALQCRYNGHCRGFYSVAQHSVLGTREFINQDELDLARQFLIHDATEAYVGDLIRPVKVEIPQFQDIESRFECAINFRFGILQMHMHPRVKEMDNIMLAWEKRDLLPNAEDWPFLPDITQYNFPEMEMWDWRKAEDEFLNLFGELF
jgi:hypothetical protein